MDGTENKQLTRKMDRIFPLHIRSKSELQFCRTVCNVRFQQSSLGPIFKNDCVRRATDRVSLTSAHAVHVETPFAPFDGSFAHGTLLSIIGLEPCLGSIPL